VNFVDMRCKPNTRRGGTAAASAAARRRAELRWQEGHLHAVADVDSGVTRIAAAADRSWK
jgi:post-segregation antitoxin (ccd killing protein)